MKTAWRHKNISSIYLKNMFFFPFVPRCELLHCKKTPSIFCVCYCILLHIFLNGKLSSVQKDPCFPFHFLFPLLSFPAVSSFNCLLTPWCCLALSYPLISIYSCSHTNTHSFKLVTHLFILVFGPWNNFEPVR